VVEIYLDGLGLAYESHKPLVEFKAFYEAVMFFLNNISSVEYEIQKPEVS
jgi:hypothetical protein